MTNLLSKIERAHFEMLEMSLLGLRRQTGSILATGLEENRDRLERKIGEVQALFKLLARHGEVSQDACDQHAKNFYEALKVR
ncbi:hypothetical protein [Asaia sp. HN010]|uniref:hypothetical protein n=1 Tax=Asaia sp. HN010 TaxID=3081233 RepID=UPI00301723B4